MCPRRTSLGGTQPDYHAKKGSPSQNTTTFLDAAMDKHSNGQTLPYRFPRYGNRPTILDSSLTGSGAHHFLLHSSIAASGERFR